jgi:hypothetical protein
MDLMPAERRLLSKAAVGERLNLAPVGVPWLDDRDSFQEWPVERHVRAEFLFDLCTGRHAVGNIHPRGLLLRGARITGQLDLRYSIVKYPLALTCCVFDEPLVIEAARIPELELSASRIPCLLGDRCAVEGRLVLAQGCTIDGGVRLRNATVGQGLYCAGVFFPDDGGIALQAGGLTAGEIFCASNEGVPFLAIGSVDLVETKIANSCNLRDALLSGSAMMDGSLKRMGLKIDVRQRDRVKEALRKRDEPTALHLNRGKIGGSLYFERLMSEGEFSLLGAEIAGVVDGSGSKIIADSRVQLRFRSKNSDLSHERTLNLADARVGRDVRLGNAVFHGELVLRGTTVGGQLDLDGARLDWETWGVVLDARRLSVRGEAGMRLSAAPAGIIDLRGAEVGEFWDHPVSWPAQIRLNGFKYQDLPAKDVSVKDRLNWLRRDGTEYDVSRYRQLAAVYRKDGKEAAARKVLVAGEARRLRGYGISSTIWSGFMRVTVGHGYRPGLALMWLIVLTVVGAVIFGASFPAQMASTRPASQLPPFNPVAYSLDVILPIVDLGQRGAWNPRGPAQFWFWFSVLAGWLLTTAVAGAIAARLRRE